MAVRTEKKTKVGTYFTGYLLYVNNESYLYIRDNTWDPRRIPSVGCELNVWFLMVLTPHVIKASLFTSLMK
tara:strand:+ start:311 stop:523 length:213 start_codon:yes stop_codon:yes gene_type:complete